MKCIDSIKVTSCVLILLGVLDVAIASEPSVYVRYTIADHDYSRDKKAVDTISFLEDRKVAYSGDFGIISERCGNERLCMDIGGDLIISVPDPCEKDGGRKWIFSGIKYEVIERLGNYDEQGPSYLIRGSGGKLDILFTYSKGGGVTTFAVAEGRRRERLVQYSLISSKGALAGGCVSME